MPAPGASAYCKLAMDTTPIDPTEIRRRELLAQLNSHPAGGAVLENRHGQVWSPAELVQGFEALACHPNDILTTSLSLVVPGQQLGHHTKQAHEPVHHHI